MVTVSNQNRQTYPSLSGYKLLKSNSRLELPGGRIKLVAAQITEALPKPLPQTTPKRETNGNISLDTSHNISPTLTSRCRKITQETQAALHIIYPRHSQAGAVKLLRKLKLHFT